MIVAQHRVDGAPVLYGPAGEFWRYKGVEVILSGPYETGKPMDGCQNFMRCV